MNTTSTLSIASLVLAGMFTTGCSQQQVDGGGSSQVAGSSQQQAEPVAEVVAPAAVTPPPAPRAARNPNSHTHPAQPNCTNSVTHVHPNGAKSHHHKYSCSGMKRARPTGNKWTHRHPAIPRCTDSVTHTHKFANRNHHHKYSCKGAKRTGGGSVNVHALQRKLKAKGYYKGPINGVVTPQTRAALQRYMKNR